MKRIGCVVARGVKHQPALFTSERVGGESLRFLSMLMVIFLWLKRSVIKCSGLLMVGFHRHC
jgi:hypothetical protein